MKRAVQPSLRHVPHAFPSCLLFFTIALLASHACADQLVATLRLENPSATTEVYATLPVPAGLLIQAGQSSLGFVDPNSGNIVPAQIRVIARRPDDSPLVLGLTAPLAPKSGVTPGTPISVQVKQLSQALPLSNAPLVSNFLNSLGAQGVQYFHEDAFGNDYSVKVAQNSADGYSILEQGPYRNTVRHFATLRPDPNAPVGAPYGTLPRGLGANSILQVDSSDPDILQVSLRIINGSVALGQNLPQATYIGRYYFPSFEVRVPAGYVVVHKIQDPMLGAAQSLPGGLTSYAILKPNADGTLHLMPAQSHSARRFAIAPAARAQRAIELLNRAGLAFAEKGAVAQNLWSWFSIGAFGPQLLKVPDLSAFTANSCNRLAQRVSQAKAILAQGSMTAPYTSPVMGLFMATLQGKYGGMTGGSNVQQSSIVAAHALNGCKAAVEAQEIEQRGIMHAREPIALIRSDGEPVNNSDVTNQAGLVQAQVTVNLNLLTTKFDGYFATKVAPKFQEQAVVAQGRTPTYQTLLESFKGIDTQHIVRAILAPMGLLLTAGDWLAYDDIQMLANASFMHNHFTQTHSSAGQPVYPEYGTVMRAVRSSNLMPRPHYGADFGREHGWTGNLNAFAYMVGDAGFRARTRAWFNKLAQLYSRIITCTGGLGAKFNAGKLFKYYRASQHYEENILQNMLYGVLYGVIGTTNTTAEAQLTQVLDHNFNGTYFSPMWLAPKPGGTLGVRPVVKEAVSPYSSSQPWQAPICNWTHPVMPRVGTIGNFYLLGPLGLASMHTGDSMFMQRAGELLGVAQPNSAAAIYSKMLSVWSSGNNALDDQRGNELALMSYLQEQLGIIP